MHHKLFAFLMFLLLDLFTVSTSIRNIALDKKIFESSHIKGYEGKYAVDGDNRTFFQTSNISETIWFAADLNFSCTINYVELDVKFVRKEPATDDDPNTLKILLLDSIVSNFSETDTYETCGEEKNIATERLNKKFECQETKSLFKYVMVRIRTNGWVQVYGFYVYGTEGFDRDMQTKSSMKPGLPVPSLSHSFLLRNLTTTGDDMERAKLVKENKKEKILISILSVMLGMSFLTVIGYAILQRPSQNNIVLNSLKNNKKFEVTKKVSKSQQRKYRLSDNFQDYVKVLEQRFKETVDNSKKNNKSVNFHTEKKSEKKVKPSSSIKSSTSAKKPLKK